MLRRSGASLTDSSRSRGLVSTGRSWAILAVMAYTVTDLLRLPQGAVSLADVDPADTSGFSGSKKEAEKQLRDLSDELSELQEQMYAAAYTGGARRVLLVLQGMDTSGKGGVVDHVIGLMNPIGIKLHSFKKPTEEELSHDFLWRVERALPEAGVVGVFDRSHYEDVLVARVHALADAGRAGATLRRDQCLRAGSGRVRHGRDQVHAAHLGGGAAGATDGAPRRARQAVEVQAWSTSTSGPTGGTTRSAYEAALERCNTDEAPWYVVPSDRKWYRNWVIGQLLLEALQGMRLSWPEPSYDVAEQRERLVASLQDDEEPAVR